MKEQDEEHTTFKYVSNFIIKLTCELEAGCKSGYKCEVIYYTGEPFGYVVDILASQFDIDNTCMWGGSSVVRLAQLT